MSNSHPYISGPNNVAQIVNHLRRTFPPVVTSATIKKLGIAPKNESYVINVLQFIGIIDQEGNRTEQAHKAFANPNDEAFAKSFEPFVKKSYSDLFETLGETAWNATDEQLITFFRQSDRTGEAIGRRQAGVFRVLSSLAGHGDPPSGRTSKKKNNTDAKATKNSRIKATSVKTPAKHEKSERNRDLGLSVRIEVNLPSDGTKQTYDDIFKSIRENLIDG